MGNGAGHAHEHTPTVSRSRLPNPGEPIPALAIPTVVMFGGAALLFGSVLWAAVDGALSYWIAVPLLTVANYLFFTVLHDASHRTISQTDGVNTWLGRFSAPFVTPLASYSVFRFIHMQHHRFTNYEDGRDPDAYTTAGSPWTWPFRWITLDLSYVAYYVPKLQSRPRREQIEYAVTLPITIALVVAFTLATSVSDLLLLIILPGRLNVMFLAFAFDWLPHHGLEDTPDTNRFRTTRNRVGLEWLMTPALIYQNYHLVHHMHPLIPFYRYIVAWRRNEDAYLAEDPPLTTVGGRELSADDYRASAHSRH
jgi:ring-1,2-phenylacetyl-CoA epoxidase subunit PaaE